MKRSAWILLVLVIIFLSSYSVLSRDGEESVYDSSNPQNFNYNTGSEQDKAKYLAEVYGVSFPGGISGVSINGDALTISNAVFTLNGVNFKGGEITIKDKEVITAKSAEVTNDFSFKGSTIQGIFSFSANTLTIEKGKLLLGSAADATLTEVRARRGVTVDVSGDQGYTGTVSAEDGPFTLGAKDQKVSVAGKAEIVKGKIKRAEKIEAITPVKGLFVDISPDLEISMVEGNIDGKQLKSSKYCLSSDCFSSKEASTAIIESSDNSDKFTIIGEMVRHRYNGQLERIVSSKKGATLEKTGQFLVTKIWTLGEGSTVTEVRAGGASSTIAVSKKTTYFVSSPRSSCDQVIESCIAIDEFNSIRVKASDDNKIKINNFKTMPTVTVDKIDDPSTVEYIEHNLYNSKRDKILLTFSRSPLRIVPAATNLEKMESRIISQYTALDGSVKTFSLEPSSKDIKIVNSNGQVETIVGHFDNWVAETYYVTHSGDIISKEEKIRFDHLIEGKLSSRNSEIMYAILHHYPLLAGDSAGADRRELISLLSDTEDALPQDVNRDDFIRRIINQLDAGKSLSPILASTKEEYQEVKEIFQQLNAVAKNDLLQAQLLEKVEEGKLSKASAVGFTSQFFASIGPDKDYTPENAQKYLGLLEKVPDFGNSYREKYLLERAVLSELGSLATLYRIYYTGDSQSADSELFEQAEVILSNNKVVLVEDNFRLPSQLKKGELNQFFNAWVNMKKYALFKGSTIPGQEGDKVRGYHLEYPLELWEKEKKLMEVLAENEPGQTKNGELIVVEELGKARRNKVLSPQLQEALSTSFHSRSISFGNRVNQLHDSPIQRAELVEQLPASIKLEILNADINILGQENGLYASSFKLIFPSLLRDVGDGNELQGREHFISFMEEQGYKIGESEDANNILMVLAASGSLPEVLPRTVEKAERRAEVYKTLVSTLISQKPAIASGTIDSLLNDKDLKQEFTTTLLQKYKEVNDKVKAGIASEAEEVQRDVVQFIVRQDLEKFRNVLGDSHPLLTNIYTEDPSERVRQLELRLQVPTKAWVERAIQRGDTRGGIPYINAGAYFVDTDKDPNEEGSFNGLANSLPGFTITDSQSDGYTLEKAGRIRVKPEGEPSPYQDVIYRVRVTKNPDDFCRNNYCAIAATRSHSYSTAQALRSVLERNTEQNKPPIILIGGCYGSVQAEEVVRSNPNIAVVATDAIGFTHVNNNVLLDTIRGLEGGCATYACLSSVVEGRPGFTDNKYKSFRHFFTASLGE